MLPCGVLHARCNTWFVMFTIQSGLRDVHTGFFVQQTVSVQGLAPV